jgi:dTDP-4-dehydrorhamnose reductase
MLGWSITQRAGAQNVVAYCSTHARAPGAQRFRRLDVDNAQGIDRLLEQEQPSTVIWAAGICDVDKCEAAPDFAWRLNVAALEALLSRLPPATRIVYCSSDHVFGGDSGPYAENAARSPISIYGRTRVAAEDLVLESGKDALVIRYGLGIGPSPDGRSGHLDWLRYRTSRGLPMTVVADEVRSAVWSGDLADRVLALARSGSRGVRHVVASRAVSRVELAGYLNDSLEIGARYETTSRANRPVPHIGNVELATLFDDELAAPLPAVAPAGWNRARQPPAPASLPRLAAP